MKKTLLLTILSLSILGSASVFAYSEDRVQEREERQVEIRSVLEAAGINLTIFDDFKAKMAALRANPETDREDMQELRETIQSTNQEYFDNIHSVLDEAGIERGPREGRGNGPRDGQGKGRGMGLGIHRN